MKVKADVALNLSPLFQGINETVVPKTPLLARTTPFSNLDSSHFKYYLLGSAVYFGTLAKRYPGKVLLAVVSIKVVAATDGLIITGMSCPPA